MNKAQIFNIEDFRGRPKRTKCGSPITIQYQGGEYTFKCSLGKEHKGNHKTSLTYYTKECS
jgi:hypothetical protein